jgi:hypothetical protein
LQNPTDKLATIIHSRLTALSSLPPDLVVLKELIKVAYLATLKTEEGRFVRGSVTFADPAAPQVLPPRVRADYPDFHPFRTPQPLTVGRLVKLSRAVDKWSASIAIFGTTRSNLVAWGIR